MLLEKFYNDLDNSDWDIKNLDEIGEVLKKKDSNSPNEELLANIERQIFRLPFRISIPTKTEDGNEETLEWSNINTFKEEDFKYIYDRFNACENIYAKSEYGLVLYYSENKRHDDFVLELLKTLFDLLKAYIKKAKKEDNYIFEAERVLSNTLNISKGRKKNTEILSFYNKVIQYIFDVHQKWEETDPKFEYAILSITKNFISYFKDFNESVNLEEALTKNFHFANSLSKSDLTMLWKANNIADISIRLSNKLKNDVTKWQYLKAEGYEKIAEIRKEDLAQINFIEKAMSIYKDIKDLDNLNRLQVIYQNLRTKQKLGGIVQEIPQSMAKALREIVKKDVADKNEDEIIRTLLLTPMIEKLVNIKKQSEASLKEPLIQNMFPGNIMDKFGNTVAIFSTEEERKQYSLLSTYRYHIDFSSKTIINYFLEAYGTDKISASGVINFLSNTWLGNEAVRQINSNDYKFSYIKSIEPGVNTFFDELNKWQKNSSYVPNFIAATDSLVLKSEYLLREICTFLGIHTFKPNVRKPGIIMEKTLDDLLIDLKGKISEDDHFFIKFVLSDKVGYNLRNKLAHGLMDNIDYQLEHVLLAIIIILKLSNYQFNK